MNNSEHINYNNHSENMSKNEIKGLSNRKALAVFIPYILSSFVFLITLLIHIPILSDTISRIGFAFVINKILEFYIYADVIAALIIFISTIMIYSMFMTKRFPSFLSLAVVIYNDITCIASSVLIYNVDLRNIFFSFQVILLIPIITIILSSVFLMDDYHDLHKGKYIPPPAKKHRKKGELLSAQAPDFYTYDENRFDTSAPHDQIIENAARMAVPKLNNASETNNLENIET